MSVLGTSHCRKTHPLPLCLKVFNANSALFLVGFFLHKYSYFYLSKECEYFCHLWCVGRFAQGGGHHVASQPGPPGAGLDLRTCQLADQQPQIADWIGYIFSPLQWVFSSDFVFLFFLFFLQSLLYLCEQVKLKDIFHVRRQPLTDRQSAFVRSHNTRNCLLGFCVSHGNPLLLLQFWLHKFQTLCNFQLFKTEEQCLWFSEPMFLHCSNVQVQFSLWSPQRQRHALNWSNLLFHWSFFGRYGATSPGQTECDHTVWVLIKIHHTAELKWNKCAWYTKLWFITSRPAEKYVRHTCAWFWCELWLSCEWVLNGLRIIASQFHVESDEEFSQWTTFHN